MISVVASDGCGALAAATAGTPYLLAIPGKRGCKTKIDVIGYTAGTTAHTATVMRAIAGTTVASTAAASQAVVNFTADPSGGLAPGPIAAADIVTIRSAATGIVYAFKVSSVSTLAITMTANLPAAFAAGDIIKWYGAPTDVDPNTGLTHPQYPLAASTAVVISGPVSSVGLVGSRLMGEPLVVHVDNITAAGTFNRASWFWSVDSGSNIGTLLGEHGGEESEEEETHEGALFGPGGTFGTGAFGQALKNLPWGQIFQIGGGLLTKWLGGLGTGAATGGTTTPPPTFPGFPGFPGTPTGTTPAAPGMPMKAGKKKPAAE